MLSIFIGIITPFTIFLLVYLINLIVRLFIPKISKIVIDDDIWSVIGVFTVITFCISLVVASLLPYQYHTKQTVYKLESLEDGQGQSGTFFLGCGKINEELKYSFYYKDKGYFKLEQLNPSYTKIKYEPNPRYIIYTTVETDNLYNKFVIGFFFEDESYVLCVPKGTIKNNYYLDTK